MTEAEREEAKRVEAERAAYRASNWRCELSKWLDDFDPPGWSDLRHAVYRDRAEFELHHIFGKEFAGCEWAWNYLMVRPAAHDFCTGVNGKVVDGTGRRKDAGTSRIGRALCLLAKEAKGEIDFVEVGKRPGFYPLGVLSIEAAEPGLYGCQSLSDAVSAFVARLAFDESSPAPSL